MLYSEPETRLGTELGVIELKHHKWLRDFDFDGLYRSQLISPIKVISKIDAAIPTVHNLASTFG